MKELVRLGKRPTYDGRRFKFFLEYTDSNGERRRVSLGHADQRKAERQRAEKERELRMGVSAPESMRLSRFWADSQGRVQGQIRESTLVEQDIAMRHLIEAIGDIDYRKVEHQHGERFLQVRLDSGNTLATAQKKIKALKRVFQLAVVRGQLEKNPLAHLQCRKIPEKEIHIYTLEECHRLLKAAGESKWYLNWELLVDMALTTAMRRGELLNVTWSDIDFEKQTVRVAPKCDTHLTWEWRIKDSERRTLPLIDNITKRLVELQKVQPEGYAYVLVPVSRYDRIRVRRRQGRWTLSDGRCPVNNFNKHFEKLQRRAAVDHGEFHDLRRTCITRWFENGLSEFDVMKLAGHSDFQTTHRFYLAVRRDLVDRARRASVAAMCPESGTNLAQVPFGRQPIEKAAEPNSLTANNLQQCVRRDSNPQPSVPKTEALSN